MLRRVHLHAARVDGRVNDDPRTSADLRKGRDVHEDRLLELGELVDDERAELEHLFEHVLSPAGEAAPVGQHKERQPLADVEVLDGLRRLVG